MEDKPIALIDSGIGGLSVLIQLTEKFPLESFVYFGDNFNAPYGNRSKRELLLLAINAINQVLAYNPKAIILACNTLSCTCLNEIRSFVNIPVFCVFPPVESEIINNYNVLLLATSRTCDLYRQVKSVHVASLPFLAKDIENKIFDLDKIDLNFHFKDVKKCFYDCVILGCTHYFFIKNQIFNHFQPQKLIYKNTNLINQLSLRLKCSKCEKTCKNKVKTRILFIGEASAINYSVWSKVVCQAHI